MIFGILIPSIVSITIPSVANSITIKRAIGLLPVYRAYTVDDVRQLQEDTSEGTDVEELA